ncbi:MAG: hypothetical protein RSF68_10555 [Myroides sp.]
MKNRVLLKSIISLCFISILTLINVSCDKDDERIDFYKNQNHSEELKGWWKRINNEEHPYYIVLDAFTFKTVSYSEIHGYYIPPEGDYWYNDDTSIFKLSVGNFKSNGVENQTPYKLSTTKDTLRLGNNPPAYYVKSVQP